MTNEHDHPVNATCATVWGIWGATAGSEDSRDLVSGFRTRIWFVNSDSGLRQKTRRRTGLGRRGLWIRTGPTMPLHRGAVARH